MNTHGKYYSEPMQPLQKISKFKQPIILGALILSFFVLMSRIDYIVHSTLYNYGLRFSYDWANSYWLTYNCIFIAFGAALSFAFWVASDKTKRSAKLSLAILGSITLLTLGGLQDILFFVLWGQGLPQTSVVWWWMPWAGIIGTWNSSLQVLLTALTSGAGIALMFGAFRSQHD
jgi:hypothetical protein